MKKVRPRSSHCADISAPTLRKVREGWGTPSVVYASEIKSPTRRGKSAQASDLAGTTSAGGAPFFAHFAEGWELECSHNGTNTCRIDGIASRPCEERKDGAPTVVLSERKPKPEVGPPGQGIRTVFPFF
jgi:hypothetical protein